MSAPSDAEVIGRSLSEPEVFGLIYDRHAATLLRFLGRRAGAKVAEGRAISPKAAGIETQYISVYVADVDAHYQRALAAGARIAHGPRSHSGYRAYEAHDLEGHRWRFLQRMREVASPK